ncbi:MAG: inositol 2-dehydrogenase [Betaproteobacteria bacterium 13_1_40CM_4_64_4]|nr:MAG: inositol 2-dehydrogenase [Betaproteobacteria bacterium 13_1_40CM_4_64_4]
MIDFCLVGAGFIGPVHAANLALHPGARLRRVIDLNPDAAKTLADKYGARAGGDLGEALADRGIGAVIICTPPRTHAPIIEAAARAGKAIFCEKPIDLDLARVDACAAVLAQAAVPFCVGFNRRFDPTHRALHDAIRAGEIGQPEMLILSSRDPEISPPDYVAAMPYGIFYDTMIHDFDMLRWLLQDEPVEIYARTACMLSEKENPHRDPDTAMVVLRMAGGALVHVNSSFRAAYGYDQRIETFGEKGMLISGNHRPTMLERHGKDGLRRDPLLHFFIDRYAESYRQELDAFIQAIETRTAPSIGLDDGRRALMIAEAGVHSARSGMPVALQA